MWCDNCKIVMVLITLVPMLLYCTQHDEQYLQDRLISGRPAESRDLLQCLHDIGNGPARKSSCTKERLGIKWSPIIKKLLPPAWDKNTDDSEVMNHARNMA